MKLEPREQHINSLRLLSTVRIETPTRELHRLSIKYLDEADWTIEGLMSKLEVIDKILHMSTREVAAFRGDSNV